jgi:hypothetical protein
MFEVILMLASDRAKAGVPSSGAPRSGANATGIAAVTTTPAASLHGRFEGRDGSVDRTLAAALQSLNEGCDVSGDGSALARS